MTYTLDGLNQHTMSDAVQYSDRLTHYIGASLDGLKKERSALPFDADDRVAAKFLVLRNANSPQNPTLEQVENMVGSELAKLKAVGKSDMNYTVRFLLHYYQTYLYSDPIKLLERFEWPISPEKWLSK